MRVAILFSVNLVFCCTHLFGQVDLAGGWDCYLESPGGALRFGLVFHSSETGTTALITNGDEQIKVPRVIVENHSVRLLIEHYDSEIKCQLLDGKLAGGWKKRRGRDEWVEMKFFASRKTKLDTANDQADSSLFTGKWLVDFEKSDAPAVAIISSNADTSIAGTFLTTTGDYRYLHGKIDGKQIKLSCFDGAHAFLFHAKIKDDKTLQGDFWSSNTWHEKWTATKNPQAALPDSFQQTKFVNEKPISEFRFPDMDGNPVALHDPKFNAKARLIYVFGSWCPNCHDAAAYFKQLQAKYGEKELSILGLAFELTGDFQRDVKQVEKYRKRHGITYPVLIAGLSDKELASKAVPFLDRVRSYPTTIFLDSKNNVRGIHTGFTGPATGNAYVKMKSRFESLIEELISEK